MLRHVLVPLDGSAFAEQALPFAVTLARSADCRLHLVRVRASLPLDPDDAVSTQYLERVAGQIASQVPAGVTRAVLTDEFGPLEYPPPAIRTTAEVLNRYATEHDVDIILMTTHGRGGLRRAWLGSVADALVRVASRPVLLIRPDDESFGGAVAADRGVHSILIPLDGSPSAEQAIPFAHRIGSTFGAHYSLLRVVSPLAWDIPAEEFAGSPSQELPQLSRAAAERYLDEIAARMRKDGLAVTPTVVLATSPAAAIIEHAELHGIDIIAMATSGAGHVRRLLLGSVADKVVRAAAKPVLVCNAQHVDAATEEQTAAAVSVKQS
jgi:nucleotide-binding universal stress UspA family protein